MTRERMTILKYCILCENYKQHPCRCTHCEDFDEFILSESGKHLILTMNKQYKKEKIVEELEKIKTEMRKYWELCDEELQAPSLKGVRTILDKHIAEMKGE